MKALVVYESMFGNTELVASAIATGLARHMEVETTDVTRAPAADGAADLIVVGGPTHAFSMTRTSTREEARRQGAKHGSETTGIREWLEQLHKGQHRERVATFDTRVERVRRLPGSAARKAAHVAHRSGYAAAAKPMSFYVVDTPGPLVDGELKRAEAWGDELGAEAATRTATRPET